MLDDAELAERCAEAPSHRRRLAALHAPFMVDEDLAGNVVPVGDAVAGMDVGHREDLVHERVTVCVPGSPSNRRCGESHNATNMTNFWRDFQQDIALSGQGAVCAASFGKGNRSPVSVVWCVRPTYAHGSYARD